MKIAIDARPFQWPGIGRYIREILQALSRLDRRNEYVVYFASDRDRVTTGPMAANFRTEVFSAGVYGPRGQLLLPGHLRREGVDILHVPFSFSLPLLYHGKLVITVHDLMVKLLPHLWPSRAFRVYYGVMTQIAVKRASRILTVSESTRSDLLRFFPSARDKTRVAYNGVNGQFRPMEVEAVETMRRKYCLERSYILSVGTLKRHKNLRTLLEAYGGISDSLRKSYQLVLLAKTGVRSPEELPGLREAVSRGQVRLLEEVAEADLPALYSGAELFVLPSLHEGFGLPLLEAMACGVPAVASNVGALPEVAGDAAMLIDPLRVEALRDTMVRLLSDVPLRETLRERGLRRAREFSWDRTAAVVLQSYMECAVL